MRLVPVRPDHRLVGRGAEEQLLAELLQSAADGKPCAVVVHGEAGVGKTRLVRELCGERGIQVLWGTCVHFGNASVPFAPIAGALQDWLTEADQTERDEVLAGIDELSTLLPSLGIARTTDAGRLLPLVDLVLHRIAERRTTVMIVDDLQWSDVASLDVLAYLIAGFRRQRLLVLATCREEARHTGHPLHTWLADMRRMPSFHEIRLERLDLDATVTQIEDLLGRPADIELAAQIQARSGGNPYLTELLVGGLPSSEPVDPATVPTALREALLSTWHGLSEKSRQLTRVLAVGGRPTLPAVLAAVAAEHGVEAELLPDCLAEAQEHGVAQPAVDGTPWFRHPLLADVLYDGMPAAQAARIHASYVRVLESLSGGSPEAVAADLAVHNERAGRIDETYRWSLTAADHAARLQTPTEEAIQLQRACRLWDQVSPAIRGSRPDRIALLRRASIVCTRAGWVDVVMELLDQALGLVDRDSEPLLASTLLVSRAVAHWRRTAPRTAELDELLEAVKLTAAFPDSPERAAALAELAFLESWSSTPEATSHADEAVRVARGTGSEPVLAQALKSRASAYCNEAPQVCLADAEEAERLARSCGDMDCLVDAAIWRYNALQQLGRTEEAMDVTLAAYEDTVAAGAGAWGYFLACLATQNLIVSGRWDEAHTVLRSALAARCTGIPGGGVRLVAAKLAVRSGRLTEARQHLSRALELVSDEFAGLRDGLGVIGAEVLVAEGKPQEALDWLRPRLTVPGQAPLDEDDDSLVMYARAAAELARTARDSGDLAGVARAVAAVEQVIDDWPREPFVTQRAAVDVQSMNQSLFLAELARCRDDPDQAERWQRAIETCGVAGAPWAQALSRFRYAEAALAAGRSTPSVSDCLRRAHRCAVAIGARPLQDQTESLARRSRISLRQPAPVAVAGQADTPLSGLTDREREILTFLVAGRSNGEIAKQLVISDKTVSVHVSNILRKTGTSSRVEAAALAERLDGLGGG
ncbi:MAG TPA: AAA family ATPase [Kribbella sp.]|nr:AAA family ATPase [Kribbella sp.]